MPELPEVETITRKLKEKALGQKINSVQVINPKIIAYPEVSLFSELLINQTINQISRRGKFIIMELDNDLCLVAHMRMTGRLYTIPSLFEKEKHTHLILTLNNDLEMRFVDPRRFGRFWLAPKGEIEEITGINKLGLEPLNPDLTYEYLKDKLGKRKKAIKTLLLDQDIITGIGNIYSDEILFKCRIFPGKKGSDLTDEEFKKLAEVIPEVINLNIIDCISQADDQLLNLLDYRNSSTIVTYQHQNTPCPNCGTELQKIKINGRGTCFCPKCQPK